jgi:hypothetical protein
LAGLLIATAALADERAGFLESFPELRPLVFEEPSSPMRLGIGGSPLGIMKHKVFMSASFFQAHWIDRRLDAELVNLSFGMTQARSSYAASQHFTARTVPKIRVNEVFSVGPLLGYEWVSFPDEDARLMKNRWHTPWEPFSSRGMIYGALLAETFPWGKHQIRVSQVYYQQTYPTTDAGDGWKSHYASDELEADPEKEEIKADQVFGIEFAVLLGFR